MSEEKAEKNKCVVGVGINLFDARAILLRGDGKVLAEVEKKQSVQSANETIKVLFELLEEVLEKAGKHKVEIKRIGLALGGIVQQKKDMIFWPQECASFVHVTFPLKDHVEKKFGLPVSVENDANACALAEHTLNFSKCKNIIYLFSGVGCGMVLDGKIYRGKSGVAGEVFLNGNNNPMASRLGDFSFLHQWPADLYMVKRAKELISLGRDSSLIKKITSDGSLHLKDILREAAKKDKLAREVVREAAFALGVKASFLINFLDPEAVVIGGGLEEGGDIFLEECLTAIKVFSLSEARNGCKIVMSPLGNKAAALGAAYLAFAE